MSHLGPPSGSRRIFAAEALADFSTVAAVAPSSPYLAAAMVRPVAATDARIVVELGAGTGVITRALLDALPRNARLFAFEINDAMFAYLKANFCDPRLVLIHTRAEMLAAELGPRGCGPADAVVSSLGLGFMPGAQRHRFLQMLLPVLHARSVFTQYHYIHGMQFDRGRLRRLRLRSLLNEYFGSVESRLVWRNLPPAYVFACRQTPHKRFAIGDL